MTAPEPHWPTLKQALRSVPAGGVVRCDDDPATAAWLRETRRDQVVDPSRGAEDDSALCVLRARPPSPEEDLEAWVAEAARVATRYVVVGSCHRHALLPSWPAPVRRMGHGDWETLFARHGLRPLARAARSAFIRPYWVYVAFNDPKLPDPAGR